MNHMKVYALREVGLVNLETGKYKHTPTACPSCHGRDIEPISETLVPPEDADANLVEQVWVCGSCTHSWDECTD